MPGPGAGGGPGGRSPGVNGGSGNNPALQQENQRLRNQLAENSLAGSDPAARRARIARQQFDRYMDTFVPIENEYVDFAMGGAGLEEAVGEARESVDTAFDSQRGQVQRGLSRYGATRSPSERASARRQNLLREAAASDQATNTARRAVEDRRLSMLAGGLNTSNPRPNPDEYY